MTIANELLAQANDYVDRRSDLAALDMWLASHVDECDDLDTTNDPAAGLAGYIQVRIYEIQAGDLSEDALRRDVVDYLAEHGLQPRRERATG